MADRLSRRDFLKGAGGASIAAIISCQSGERALGQEDASPAASAAEAAPETNQPGITQAIQDTAAPTGTNTGVPAGPSSATETSLPTSAQPEPVTEVTTTPTVYAPVISAPFKSDRLNFITIVCDTWRYDFIGSHGGQQIQTPNLDAFAAQSQVFSRTYAGGFPTLLHRAELLSGRYMFPLMGWEDMPADEISLAQLMNAAGYSTGLVFDTLHFKDSGFSLDRSFQSWEWVRGQEADRYRITPLHPPLPADPSKFRHGEEAVGQYLRNMADRTEEADYMGPRTLQKAMEWLRRVYGQNSFYLHIDCFDPHEPWDPPQSYVDLYNPGYVGEQIIYPAYAPSDYLTPEELNHVRALYAGEVTMVDHWFGVLMDELETLGLAENTVVIFTSDHGILLGEHEKIGKALDHAGHYECYPLYQELVHIPLMVRMPGKAAREIQALAQPVDVAPTILELAGAEVPATLQGVSLVPAIEDVEGTLTQPTRPVAVAARSLETALSAKPRITVTDGEWSLLHGAAHASSELYYLPNDPEQQMDLIYTDCPKVRDLHNAFVSFLESIEVDETFLSAWRPAPC